MNIIPLFPHENSGRAFDDILFIPFESGKLSVQRVVDDTFNRALDLDWLLDPPDDRMNLFGRRLKKEGAELWEALDEAAQSLSASILYDAFVKKDLTGIEFLGVIEDYKTGYIKCWTVVRLLQVLTPAVGCYQRMEGSSFTGLIEEGNVFDERFMLIHLLHWLANRAEQGKAVKIWHAISLTQNHAELYQSEEQIAATERLVMQLWTSLLRLLHGDSLDGHLRAHFEAHAKAKKLSNVQLMRYISGSIRTPTENLIVDELVRIGFNK